MTAKTDEQKEHRRNHARADRGVAVYAPDGRLVGRFNSVTRELKLTSTGVGARDNTKGAHK